MVMSSTVRAKLLSLVPVSCLLVGVCLTAVGCDDDETKLTLTDTGPPSLVWHVWNVNTQTLSDYPGDATIDVAQGDRYLVVLNASNPGGVEQVEFYDDDWMICKNGNVETSQGPESGQPVTNEQMPKAYVFKDLSVTTEFTVPTAQCQDGYTFDSGGIRLNGSAHTFFGTPATATLTFNILP
jgi:hypothetical protein